MQADTVRTDATLLTLRGDGLAPIGGGTVAARGGRIVYDCHTHLVFAGIQRLA